MGPWPPNTFLGALSPATREKMLTLGTPVQVSSGQMLILEGERRNRDVFLITHGYVKVVSNSEDGKVVLLAIRADGDIVGELAALDGGPRLASVVTVGSCFVRKIGQAEFRDFLRRHPDAALAANVIVSAKLRLSTWYRVEFGTSAVPVRVARTLLYLATRYGEPTPDGVLIGSLTQPELAAMIGSREATVYKILKALRTDNVIETKYGRILIRDRAALCAKAGISGIPPEYGVWPGQAPQSDEH
ncbi:Crp/Fnr family transcriptional regulator [Thermopolyspora sp. NPDC052614]|uniref:Crp/Fnr family transcriptional regulator n=1 Tax=Thermopolyspora sp. NPDC052614 TaxID=3155682 RepID=UPI003425300A